MRRLAIEVGGVSSGVVGGHGRRARRDRHARCPALERCEARISPSGVAPGGLAISSHLDRGALYRPIESI
jgi:hypothetical protein